jgi:hypothetical protein
MSPAALPPFPESFYTPADRQRASQRAEAAPRQRRDSGPDDRAPGALIAACDPLADHRCCELPEHRHLFSNAWPQSAWMRVRFRLVRNPNCRWEIAPTARPTLHPAFIFPGKPGLARVLNKGGHGSAIECGGQKGRKTMFGSNAQRQMVAFIAAILMSTVAVGAAVAPAAVSSQSVAINA